MLRYAITDSQRFGCNLDQRRAILLEQTARLAADQVSYVQLREKDLEAGELLLWAGAMLGVLRTRESAAKLLINSRADVAAAANAHGVHLTSHSDELTPNQVRSIFAKAQSAVLPVVSVSCHTLDDVARAAHNGSDLLLFGPVFEKRVGAEHIATGTGVKTLREACRIADAIPVLALGGVTQENLSQCLEAGAAGIAGIRIFH